MPYFRRINFFRPRRHYLGLILTLIMFTIIFEYHRPTMLVESDSLHPLTTHWESINLQEIIRPEIDTTIIRPEIGPDTCKDAKSHPNGRLCTIIMVTSAPINKDSRKAIRETWANKSTLPSDMTVLFILGRTMDEYVTKSIYEEAMIYRDMIVEDFIDCYENLTLKSLFSLKWVSNNCEGATHLLKTDDDMLILVENLQEILTEINLKINNEKPFARRDDNEFRRSNYKDNYSKYFTKKHFLGPYFNGTKEISTSGSYVLGYLYHKIKPIRDKDSKWFLPYTLYPKEYLPDFISGTAYIIAAGNGFQGTMKSILMNSLLTKSALPLEDVFITGIISNQVMGMPLLRGNKQFHKTNPLIHPWSVSELATCFYDRSIAIHGLKANEILQGWQFIKRINAEKCTSLKGYFYTSLYSILALFEQP